MVSTSERNQILAGTLIGGIPYGIAKLAGFDFGGGGPENVGGTDIASLKAQRENGTQDLRGSGFQAQAAYDAFIKYFGREPSEVELSDAIPSFGGSGGFENGNAYVARLAQLYQKDQADKQANDPVNIAKKERDQLATATQEFIPTSHKIVNETLGREATDEEVNYFAGLMAQGYTAYEIQSAVKNTTEYKDAVAKKQQVEQQAADLSARNDLRSELSTADTSYLTQDVAPALQSYFAKRGRATSPALEQSLASEAGKLNTEREKYLAHVAYSDYSKNKSDLLGQYAAARGDATTDYRTKLSDYYGDLIYGRTRSDSLSDANTNRGYQLQDYNINQSAYNQYLQNYGKRNWVDYLNTGLGMAANLRGATKGMGSTGVSYDTPDQYNQRRYMSA